MSMRMVVAEGLFGAVEYVSPLLPAAKGDELARALRRLTRLRVLVESVPGVPTGDVQAAPDAN